MIENLKKIEELLDYNFLIDTYQRGYRWDTTQVFSLLNDINEFTPEFQSFYCLQPLVVKKLDDKTFELIDGQQRATTICLILIFFDSKRFQLLYSTRNTEENGINSFFESITDLSTPEFLLNNELEDFQAFDNIISKHWKEKITQNNPDINNVDNFYFYRSFCVIKNWFNPFDEKSKQEFLQKLLTLIKVIWYVENEESSDKKIIKKFIDFNEGKIELEQAELIKALFVLDILKNPNVIQRQYDENHFADDWNLIEHQMGDDKFWQFISNNKNDKNISNKINLLFQLHNGFGKAEDHFYNYRKFEKSSKTTIVEDKLNWDKITTLYNSLEEWFFDRTSYHLTGAIIHLTNFNISKILETAVKSDSKKAFRNNLRSILSDFFKDNGTWKKGFDPQLIKYNESGIFKVLFLYNIALTEVDEKDSFFPFYRFYDAKNWNIEHILAKNDDGLETFEEFSSFHNDIKSLLEVSAKEEISEENKSIITNLLDELYQLIDTSKKAECKRKIKEINDKIAEFFSIDDFNNLCLLDQSTNIKVGKKPFRRKRNIVLNLDLEIKIKKDAYIPIGTKYVFSKKSTPSEFYQINYWSLKDRKYYDDIIKITINNFLKHEKDGAN
ncbi:DUF262 domain-containing protein [Chryseobacterium camelliae]|uniref:DUF262 domain-containing protein n=1 Tax=Chryseobacterium camelliae TaxID=1265445 RepID=UPI000C1C88DC|nr:DUF262 domain-containing protein [Chryseobacterium camelliae]